MFSTNNRTLLLDYYNNNENMLNAGKRKLTWQTDD